VAKKVSKKRSVKVRVPETSLGNADIVFECTENSGRLGSFQISKGSIEFIPANAKASGQSKKVTGYKVDWKTLAKWMAAHGTKSQIKRQ
jgi:hypothetical protein